MNTSDILDLFQLGEAVGGGKSTAGPMVSTNSQPSGIRGSSATNTAAGTSTLKTILEGVPDLWDEDQYGGEYDMNRFMQSLKATQNE